MMETMIRGGIFAVAAVPMSVNTKGPDLEPNWELLKVSLWERVTVSAKVHQTASLKERTSVRMSDSQMARMKAKLMEIEWVRLSLLCRDLSSDYLWAVQRVDMLAPQWAQRTDSSSALPLDHQLNFVKAASWDSPLDFPWDRTLAPLLVE